jgi:release factor glutamine methyltransferase
VRVQDILRGERDVERIDLLALLSSALSLSTEKLMIQAERELSSGEEGRLRHLLHERRRGRPTAYITGTKEFYSRGFRVDPRSLIPRPETEILVEEALQIISDHPGKIRRIVDVGTGSGAIGITLAKESGKKVICADISRDALQLAKVNVMKLGALDLVDLVCSDLLSGFGNGGQFDLIVANLPYVSEDEWPDLMPDVRLFEPKLALWGGSDGLEIYRKLVFQARHYLSGDGYLLCEIGGLAQAEAISILLNEMGLSSAIKRDLSGRDRVVIGSCKSL